MLKFFFPFLVFVLIGFLVLANTDRITYSLSSQGDIDPQTLTGEYDTFLSTAVYNNQVISIPSKIAGIEAPDNVLGTSNGNKRIEVDLSSQRLYAYEGDRRVYDFLVSTGKWGKTPTGTFSIWSKFRATRMKGGSQALHTYYDLPNVPYTMFFYNSDVAMAKGFGIHGTYWHSNFGHPMSHGCVNMKTEEAALLYSWADPSTGGKSSIRATSDNPGTTVVIYGTAPST